MNGKGSKPRPANKKQFDANWDEINWKSKNKKEDENASNRQRKDTEQTSGVGDEKSGNKVTEEISHG